MELGKKLAAINPPQLTAMRDAERAAASVKALVASADTYESINHAAQQQTALYNRIRDQLASMDIEPPRNRGRIGSTIVDSAPVKALGVQRQQLEVLKGLAEGVDRSNAVLVALNGQVERLRLETEHLRAETRAVSAETGALRRSTLPAWAAWIMFAVVLVGLAVQLIK